MLGRFVPMLTNPICRIARLPQGNIDADLG